MYTFYQILSNFCQFYLKSNGSVPAHVIVINYLILQYLSKQFTCIQVDHSNFLHNSNFSNEFMFAKKSQDRYILHARWVSALKAWKTLWPFCWVMCIDLETLLGAAINLLQALHVFPDQTHIPLVTPITRDKNIFRSATSSPAAKYAGPGTQFCADLQSNAANKARDRHLGLTWASCKVQQRLPKAGMA